MKKRFTSVILVALVVFLAVTSIHSYSKVKASVYTEQMAELEKKKQELEKLLKDAEARKKEFEKQQAESKEYLSNLSGNIDEVTKYIEEVDAQLQNIYDRIADLNFQISEKEEELENTKQELADAIIQQQEQYETMKSRVRYIYENGTESIWDILVNSKSLIDLLNRVEYRAKIAEYDDSLLDRYMAATELVKTNMELLEASLANLESLKEEATLEKEACEELSAKKSEQLEAYMAAYDLTEDIIAQYGQKVDLASSDINQLYKDLEANEKATDEAREAEKKRLEEEERKRKEEEERKRREEAAKAAAEAAAKKKAEEEARKKAEALLKEQRLNAATGITMTTETSINKMIWPLPGDGRISGGFGYRSAPIAGASSFHNGIDLGGEHGATIVAALAGTVAYTGYNYSAGNYVQIDHGNGLQTRYVHCSKILVSPGDYVLQGQPIALVGSTGLATGPHLHFAILINWTYVNPAPYIKYKE